MEGKVVKCFDDKGYGFISDSEGNSRFFHISDVKSKEKIENYCNVKFSPATNEKGMTAKDVFIIIDTRPLFITLGDIRIKLTNIKDYGMSSEIRNIPIPGSDTENKTFLDSKVANNIFTALKVFSALGKDARTVGHAFDDTAYSTLKYEDKKFDILYITTYQKDNYRFSEYNASFNIHEKLEELDKYMG